VRVYPPRTIATPLTVIQRERMLPVPGEILVREGERVEPVQVIGRALVPAGFHIVNVARGLGVPAASVSRYLKVKPGQKVKRGQVLAALRGLAARSCQSPIDGTVTGSGGGRLLIEAPAQEVELRANIYGVVARVVADRGVVIRTSGALLQGVWGNGKEGTGVLRLLVKGRSEPLRSRAIDASCRGAVLIGGQSVDREALERASEIQARGIICGGIVPNALPDALKAPFPIVVTEGVGVIPMCPRIYRLLEANDGREATLDARFQSRWGIVRPEVIVPLPAEPEAKPLEDVDSPLKVGDTVRVVRAPHLGETGTVTAFPVWMRTSTGARLPAARIDPEDGQESLLVPLRNLEILR